MKFKEGDKVRNILPYQRQGCFRSIGIVTDVNPGIFFEVTVKWGEEDDQYSNIIWHFGNADKYLTLYDDFPDDGRKDKWL